MRLNFSGVGRRRHPRGRAPDRRGRARAGRAVRDAHRRGAAGARAAEPAPRAGRPGPGRRAAAPAPRRSRRAPADDAEAASMTRASRSLKGGRSLERQVSLRSGARVEDALERLGHEVDRRSTSAHDLVARLRDARPDVAFVALHGRDGEDGTVQELLEVARHPLHRRRACRPACAASDKVLAKHAMRDAGHPDARLLRLQRDRVQGARRRATRCRRHRGAPRASRSSSSRPTRARALGIKFAAHRRRRARPRSWRPSPTTDKVLLERHVARPRPGGLDPRRRGRCPIVEAVPREEDFYDFEARYEIGRTELRLPGRARPTRSTARAQELALRRLPRCSAAAASPAST